MSPKLLNILLILIPAVLYFGYLKPLYTGEEGLVWGPEKGIRLLQSENVQYENTLNQMSLIKESAEKLNKDFVAVDKKLKGDVFTFLPDSVDPVKLRNEVLNIGAASGIAINGLRVEKDLKGEGGLNFYKVSFSVTAKYATFKKFMESYEKNKRFFILEQASIRRQEKENKTLVDKAIDEDALEIAITSRVYYIK